MMPEFSEAAVCITGVKMIQSLVTFSPMLVMTLFASRQMIDAFPHCRIHMQQLHADSYPESLFACRHCIQQITDCDTESDRKIIWMLEIEVLVSQRTEAEVIKLTECDQCLCCCMEFPAGSKSRMRAFSLILMHRPDSMMNTGQQQQAGVIQKEGV
jgi:hypothetical protein